MTDKRLDSIKMIDGKPYGLWGTRNSKLEAQREANRIRLLFSPCTVRVIEYCTGWAIYRRNGGKRGAHQYGKKSVRV